MATEVDPWGLDAPPDWSDVKIQFDRNDPSKTIPLSWARDMLQRWHARSPAQFGNRLGEVVTDWTQAKYGTDER